MLLIITFIAVDTAAEVPQAGTDIIVDNDHGEPFYKETGTWTTSLSKGYDESTYRFTTPGQPYRATWTAPLGKSGNYDVFVFYRAGDNRVAQAHYVIEAADGSHGINIDQTQHDREWVKIGTFPFAAGDAKVTIDAMKSAEGSAVIADAVRFTLTGQAKPVAMLTPFPVSTPGAPFPALTPTPVPPDKSILVKNIYLDTVEAKLNKRQGVAKVTIVDRTDKGIAGATVTGSFSGDFKESVKAVTDENGIATLRTSETLKGIIRFMFRVTNVEHPTFRYSPDNNIETADIY